MKVDWRPLLGDLHSAALAAGVNMPLSPVTDSEWHVCAAAGGPPNGGAYLMFEFDAVALFGRRAAGSPPQIWDDEWQPASRTVQERLWLRIAAVLETFPSVTKRAEHKTRSPATVRVNGYATANVAISPPRSSSPALRASQAFLEAKLAKGPVLTAEIHAQAANANVSWASIRRAAAVIGVVVMREGYGASGHWYWGLPTTPPRARKQDATK
jgi:hypothetical protein